MEYNWLLYQAETVPDKPAVIFNDITITFSELYDEALAAAGRLKYLNRKRLGLHVGNTPEAVILIHACIQAGIEMVMINVRLTPAEIIKQLNDVDVDTIITTKPFSMEECQVLHYFELMDLKPRAVVPYSAHAGETLSIMFTSGTTGRAKAVKQSYGNHLASAFGCESRFNYNKDSIWMDINPIYHISGFSILMRTVIRGCTMVLVERFDEEAVWEEISLHSVTHTSMVPVMLERLMKFTRPHQLEGILLGGAGVTMDILRRALESGLPVYNSFGMTETCSQIVSIGPKDPEILKGTVGRPLDNISIKIDESNDSELLVKGPPVTKGYLNADISLDEGYFRTGDMGYIDEDGYLYILDRRNDLIISGGENIYPKEIEDIAMSIEGIQKAVVVKRKDSSWGEVPVLLVQPDSACHLDRSKITAYLKLHLAKYKLPKEIHEVQEVKMTSTGKVSRAENQKVYDNIKSSSI